MSYRIVRLESENVKRLKAVAIEPSGNLIEITGANEAGKTSLMDSIFFALAGKGAVQPDPIRHGEKEAKIMLNLGPITVRQKMWRGEDGELITTVVVDGEGGMRAAKPQTFLNDLIGELTFDPLAFTRMKPKEQYDLLKQFVTGFDFEAWAQKRKAFFDERQDTRRRAGETRARADGYIIPEETPDEQVDISALLAEMQRAGEFNAGLEGQRRERQAESAALSDRDKRLAKTMEERAELQRRLDMLDETIELERKYIEEQGLRFMARPPLRDPIDPTTIREKIEIARQTNDAVSAKTNQKRIAAEADILFGRVKDLTAKIDSLDEDKAKAIAAAQMPVPGFGFGDELITLHGVPFEQAAASQQLRASAALAMAKNPKLRVMLIRDGSLLGEKAMQELAAMAAEQDYQIWVETVESDSPGAIIIEDGMVKAVAEAAE